jgi:hypothetical protein
MGVLNLFLYVYINGHVKYISLSLNYYTQGLLPYNAKGLMPKLVVYIDLHFN